MPNRCPVLTELDLMESYNPEHENPPNLSQGDYDIEAIRFCGKECPISLRNRMLEERVQELEEILNARRTARPDPGI